MDIEKLILTKCRVIKRLNTFTFLVEDLLDNKEKEMKFSAKKVYSILLKEDEIVYATYSPYKIDKSVVELYTYADFKRHGSMKIYEAKEFLDNYLSIEAKEFY